MNRIRIPGLLAALVLLGACAGDGPLATADGPDTLDAVLMAGAGGDGRAAGPGNASFDRIAAQVPGFAGMYRTERCAAVVLLTGGDADEALRVVNAVIGPLVSASCPHGLALTAGTASYTYVELQRFFTTARAVLGGVDGVLGVSIDYKQNALIVGVMSSAVAERAAAALRAEGVPPGAVVFRVRGAGITPRG